MDITNPMDLAQRFADNLKVIAAGLNIKDFDNPVFDEFEEGQVSVAYGDLGVDVGYPVEMKTLAGARLVSGYRVWEIKHSPGSRWDPPDAWDVDALLTPAESEAVTKLIHMMVDWHVDGFYRV